MRSRGRKERRRSRSRSGRSKRGWRRGGDRRLRERGLQGRTGEAGGRERRLEVEVVVAPSPEVPGSPAVEGGVTGRGRRRTSGGPRVEAAQTEMIEGATLPVVVHPDVALPDVALPDVVLLHPRKVVVAAPGGGRDPTGRTGHHQDVTGDSRDLEPGDKAVLLVVVPEILVTEDLHQGVRVVMVHQDALLIVMFGGVVELEVQEEVPIVLPPEEVAVIVTLVVLEEADVIATLVPEDLQLTVVTTPDLEMTDHLTGVKVRLAVESADHSLERNDQEKRDQEKSDLEMRDLEMRDQEKDQLANLMTAGRKSSVNPFPIKTLFGENFFLRWKFSRILH